MARKRMKSKIQPAVQTMLFSTPTIQSGGGNAQFYIDLSQCASLLNRRFYRQGINWAVSSIKILSTSFNGSVFVSKLPNTWVMSNAWEKAFRAWQRMNKDAMDDSEQESLSGKFLDFKIYADATHHANGFGDNLLPVDSANNQATVGEWIPSEIVVPLTTTPGSSNSFEIMAVGGNYPGAGASGLDAVSMIEGYSNSRALPSITDPNTPDDAIDSAGATPENWLVGMFNEGTTQDSAVIDHITDYDQPPYPYENDGTNLDTMYPGGQNQLPALQVHSVEFQTPTTIGGTTMIKGGNFPCGLIKLDCTNSGDRTANLVLEVNLVPGTHRGYLCEPMTEM